MICQEAKNLKPVYWYIGDYEILADQNRFQFGFKRRLVDKSILRVARNRYWKPATFDSRFWSCPFSARMSARKYFAPQR